MSYGQFVHLDRHERLAREASQRRGSRTSAISAIRYRFPEFVQDGRVDRLAVDALLHLWAEHGKGKVTRPMVIARRDQIIDQMRSEQAT